MQAPSGGHTHSRTLLSSPPLPPSGGGSAGWRPALEQASLVGEPGGCTPGARPVVAFSPNGRSGFGTGSTGARVTIGGALLAEQVRGKEDVGHGSDSSFHARSGAPQAFLLSVRCIISLYFARQRQPLRGSAAKANLKGVQRGKRRWPKRF